MHEKAGKVRLSADELEAGLSRWAQRSADSRGRERPEEPCTLRTPYQRDRGRIVHCKSFRRLEHKTQVFIAPEGDHYRTRLTHTLEVAGIARSIARALRLNEDLTEAIALGHDLGHTPFGHAGEKVMREVLEELGAGVFKHNEQSARVVEVVENDGRGLNLTWEVRDGIRHHTGDEKPVTLEGQIVRFADRIAYINHDIDDAVRAELITPADLPQEPLSLLGGHGRRPHRRAGARSCRHELRDRDHRPEPGGGEGHGRAEGLPVPDRLPTVPAARRRAARASRHHQLDAVLPRAP